MELRDKLKIFFEETGIQKKWFAEKIGMNPNVLYMVLAGKKKLPRKFWQKVIELTNGKITKQDLIDDLIDDI